MTYSPPGMTACGKISSSNVTEVSGDLTVIVIG
jgi:hypothetical protein